MLKSNLSCVNQNNQETLYRIEKNNKVGYIDSTGKEVIKPQYMAGSAFFDGLALVKVDTIAPDSFSDGNYYKYGYIDKNNNFIIISHRSLFLMLPLKLVLIHFFSQPSITAFTT